MVGTTSSRNVTPAGHLPVNSPHVLWALAKKQARAVIQLRRDINEFADVIWTLSREAGSLRREVHRLQLDVAQWRNAYGRLQVERDEIAQESALREQEIITLTVDRDKLEARLSELDTPGPGGVA